MNIDKFTDTIKVCRFCFMCRHLSGIGNVTFTEADTPRIRASLIYGATMHPEKLFAGVIPGKFFEISSTEIRNSMEKNAFTGNIKCMTENIPEIGDYMTRHRLYGENSTKETDYERN